MPRADGTVADKASRSLETEEEHRHPPERTSAVGRADPALLVVEDRTIVDNGPKGRETSSVGAADTDAPAAASTGHRQRDKDIGLAERAGEGGDGGETTSLEDISGRDDELHQVVSYDVGQGKTQGGGGGEIFLPEKSKLGRADVDGAAGEGLGGAAKPQPLDRGRENERHSEKEVGTEAKDGGEETTPKQEGSGQEEADGGRGLQAIDTGRGSEPTERSAGKGLDDGESEKYVEEEAQKDVEEKDEVEEKDGEDEDDEEDEEDDDEESPEKTDEENRCDLESAISSLQSLLVRHHMFYEISGIAYVKPKSEDGEQLYSVLRLPRGRENIDSNDVTQHHNRMY